MSATERDVQDPRRGSAVSRFVRGGGYLLQGFGFVFRRNPSLIKYALLPILISLLVGIGVMIGLFAYGGDIIDWLWKEPAGTWGKVLWYTLYVFFVIVVVLLAAAVFFVGQALLSAPFNDALSERVEVLAFDHPAPPFSLARLTKGLVATVVHEAGKLSVYLAVMAALFVIKLAVPLVGMIVFLVGGFVLTARFFSYDYMDLCMARREMKWKAKWSLLRRNRSLTFGFGSAMAGALMIPLVGLVFVPMAVVGATLLFGDLEQSGDLEADPPAVQTAETGQTS